MNEWRMKGQRWQIDIKRNNNVVIKIGVAWRVHSERKSEDDARRLMYICISRGIQGKAKGNQKHKRRTLNKWAFNCDELVCDGSHFMGFSHFPFLSNLQSLLRTADYLKIKGLSELTENREETSRLLSATLGGNWPLTTKSPVNKRARLSESATGSSSGVSSCMRSVTDLSTTGLDNNDQNQMVRSSTNTNRTFEHYAAKVDRTYDLSEIDLTKTDEETATKENDRLIEPEGQQKSVINTSKPRDMASLGMGVGMVSLLYSLRFE